MEQVKAKLAVWSKDRSLVRTAAGVGAAMLLLIVCLCISIYMRSNIQRRMTRAIDAMQEQTYQQLIEMAQLFERVDEPGVDVRYKLIPELRAEYASAEALNTALARNFGERNAVLSADQTAAFEAAFDQYSDAYRNGLATGLAQADMTACIQDVQRMIGDRYTPTVEPTEPIVIIDGSSGEIANAQDSQD